MKLPFFKKQQKIPEKLFIKDNLDINDIIAPSSFEVNQGHIKMGERLSKSFFIFSYPRYLNTGWFSSVINLDAPMDISFFIHHSEH